ncbi:inner centromere protein [Schizophyllum amplum]|uniref:Inner centromere protein n=1 Tax=Schizophyllum amplum TaxID=97359 RepID=A0A550CNC1_9AGAR|nr:inner centromere protein [Auriculariopsis ampla]
MQAAKAAAEPNLGPTENIELPDINSEYSDSDDEDRKTYDVADWAQSPDLARMLRVQSTINPDEIFGDIRPLRMEEIFRTRQSRFRARTSSANWTGSDRLTVEEQQEYARRMGYR